MNSNVLANKETAMRLWTSRYGKEKKVVDYAGRMMDKAAYGDRNSEFGWNLDHIFPESKGGKTADYNLVCCHILTNDEKADKICFNANGQSFKVVKVENHYEIVNQNDSGPNLKQPTLFDSAYGVRRFKELLKKSKEKKFCAEILVDLRLVKTSAVFDFIREIFNSENVNVYSKDRNVMGLYCFSQTKAQSYLVIIRSYDVGLKSLIQDLLDKCLLLNTYLSHYFAPMKYLAYYDTYFNVTCNETADEYYRNVELKDMGSYCGDPTNSLYISELVVGNTNAEENLGEIENLGFDPYGPRSSENKDFGGRTYVMYNYEYSKLAKNLDKEVSRQD